MVRSLFHKVSHWIFAVALIGFGAWGVADYASQLYSLSFSDAVFRSVAELQKEDRALEAASLILSA